MTETEKRAVELLTRAIELVQDDWRAKDGPQLPPKPPDSNVMEAVENCRWGAGDTPGSSHNVFSDDEGPNRGRYVLGCTSSQQARRVVREHNELLEARKVVKVVNRLLRECQWWEGSVHEFLRELAEAVEGFDFA